MLAGLLLLGAQALATPALTPIPGIVSTGAGLAQGATDVNFLLISAPSGVPANILHPVVICSTVGCDGGAIPAFPFWPSYWIPNDAHSQWVGVNAVQYGDTAAHSGAGTGITTGDPAGWYIFQVAFYVPNALAQSTAHITGSFSADNQGEVWFNNVDVRNCHLPYCFQDMYSFNITSGFVVGMNYLDFRVYNVNQALGNPVGFRVNMSGTYMFESPEPGTAALWLAGLVVLVVLRRRKAA